MTDKEYRRKIQESVGRSIKKVASDYDALNKQAAIDDVNESRSMAKHSQAEAQAALEIENERY